MWFYRLILLITLIASWMPRESKSYTSMNSYHQESHRPLFIDFEEPEEQEDDEGEELALNLSKPLPYLRSLL